MIAFNAYKTYFISALLIVLAYSSVASPLTDQEARAAVYSQNIQQLKVLVANGSDLEDHIYSSVQYNLPQSLEFLLQHSKKPNQYLIKVAIDHNSVDVIPILVKAGLDLNTVRADNAKEASLISDISISNEPSADMINMLIKQGYKPREGELNESVTFALPRENQLIVLDTLFKLGAVVSEEHQFEIAWMLGSMYYYADDEIKVNTVFSAYEKLVKHGLDFNTTNRRGENTLFGLRNQAKNNPKSDHKLLIRIIKDGANINQQDVFGNTILHKTSGKLMKLLIHLGADETIKNNDGHTAKDLIPNPILVVFEFIRDSLSNPYFIIFIMLPLFLIFTLARYLIKRAWRHKTK